MERLGGLGSEMRQGAARSADVPVEPSDAATPAPGASGFDAFAAAVSSKLLRTAYLLTGDRQEAEDLVQDALVRTWTRWERVRRADSPTAYAQRVLVTRSVSRWRSARRRLATEHLVADAPEAGTVDLPQWDDGLWRAVLALPPRQRAVVVLCYYEDLPDAEVASVLGCVVGTVKSQRAKALRTLRTRVVREEAS